MVDMNDDTDLLDCMAWPRLFMDKGELSGYGIYSLHHENMIAYLFLFPAHGNPFSIIHDYPLRGIPLIL